LKKNEIPKDPWGNPYQYKSPGQHGDYDLWSYGADNSPGGEGENTDSTSWGGKT
jgi:general secretion pathway protein G